MQQKTIPLLIVLLLAIAALLLYNNCNSKTVPPATANNTVTSSEASTPANSTIDQLTREAIVVAYVKTHKQLPDYYITKKAAREKGWIAAQGNLCAVLPGKAIGGDAFSNREGQLPQKAGRSWYEADLNYNCGNRNADRLLFSSDGLLYVTYDHYKTFVQK